MTLAMLTFQKKIYMGCVGTVPAKILAKFGVCSIRHFNNIVHWYMRTQEIGELGDKKYRKGKGMGR